MPRVQPLLSFLRPLAAPKASSSRQLMRFSSAIRLHVDVPQTSIDTPIVPLPTAATPVSPSSPTPKAPTSPPKALKVSPNTNSSAPRPIPQSNRTKLAKSTQSTNSPNDISISPNSTASSKAKAQKLRPSGAKTQTPKTPVQIQATMVLPPPKYHVSRSHNRNYPVYTDYKRGGNLKLTTIRKITGDLSALRDELRVFLNKQDGEVKVNQLTSHVIVKGHHVGEITEFLKARGL